MLTYQISVSRTLIHKIYPNATQSIHFLTKHYIPMIFFNESLKQTC